MRSPLWFVLAGIVAIGGFVCGGFYMAPRLENLIPDLGRVVMPDSESLALDRAGAYTLYIENRSFLDGKYYDSDLPSGVQILLASEATGVQVKLDDARSTMSYSMGNRSGKALAGFTIDQPGRYRLSAVLPPGQSAPPFVLAIGYGALKDSLTQMGRTIGGFFIFVSIGTAIAGTITGVTIWQRTKVKRTT
jgi:hypothetical protein